MSLLLRLLLFIYLSDFNNRSKLVNIYFCLSFAVALPVSLLFLAGKRCLPCPTHLFFSCIFHSLFSLTLFLLLNCYETNISIIKVFLSSLHGILSFSFVWLLNTDMHPPIDSPHIYTHTLSNPPHSSPQRRRHPRHRTLSPVPGN